MMFVIRATLKSMDGNDVDPGDQYSFATTDGQMPLFHSRSEAERRVKWLQTNWIESDGPIPTFSVEEAPQV